jgi:hypothetical protein
MDKLAFTVAVLTFISTVVGAVAWPVVTLIVAIVFRKAILELLPAIRSLKAGPLAVDFENKAKDIRVKVAEESASERARLPETALVPNQFSLSAEAATEGLLIARADPTGSVLDGWGKVDGEIFRLGKQMGEIVDPLEGTHKVYSWVMRSTILPVGTKQLIQGLRDLRNQVAHRNVIPTTEAAQNYLASADRVVELIHNYRKNLPNYSPSNR